MEVNHTEKTICEVAVQGAPFTADAGPVLDMVFAILSFVFWASGTGRLGEGSVLAIGLLQLGVFATYTVGGTQLLKRGNGFGGNCFLLFGALFGAGGGLTHIGMAVAAAMGQPLDGKVLGLSFLICGIFLLFMLLGLAYTNLVNFLLFLSAGLGVLGFGLTGTGVLPGSFNVTAGWILFAAGCIAAYNSIAGMLGFLGVKLPMGAPIAKKK